MSDGGEGLKFKHIFTQENPGSIDDYYVLEKKTLGEGSYGQVCQGKDKSTGAMRAVKAIDRSKISNEKKFEEEVGIQQQLDHPNIVKLYEVFKDAKRVYLVMELCTGGELFDRIVEEAERNDGEHAFGEAQCAIYMQQILGAMLYLHSKCFVHRDIKPENFLMQNKGSDAEIKVIDFGLAKSFIPGSGAFMKTRAGTPYYVAPEVLRGRYHEKCDIWSCGVIMYILLSGYPPFYGDRDEEILGRVKRGAFDFPRPDWDNVSKEAKQMITSMLTVDMDKRPSAEDLIEHPWLQARATASTGTIDPKLGERLKQFRSVSKIKKVALTVIAQQLKDDQLTELRNTFSALDRNKDGMLSAAEIREGMAKHNVSIPPDLEETIRNLDTDGSGKIDYTEFVAATISTKQYLQREVIWSAFRTFDKDGDGKITVEELKQILNDKEELAEEMVREVDLNKDGVISYEEFTKMMEGGVA